MAGWIFGGVAVLVLLGIFFAKGTDGGLQRKINTIDIMILFYNNSMVSLLSSIYHGNIKIDEIWSIAKNDIKFLEFFGYKTILVNEEMKMIACQNTEKGCFMEVFSSEYSDEVFQRAVTEKKKIDQTYNTQGCVYWIIPNITDEEIFDLKKSETLKNSGVVFVFQDIQEFAVSIGRNKEAALKVKEVLRR